MNSGPRFFTLFQRAASPWTCRACAHHRPTAIQSKLRHATRADAAARVAEKPGKRRRIVLLASAGTAVVGLGALSISDQARHAAIAAERSGRVLSTLALCINDYRVTLNQQHDDSSDHDALLKACHKRCAERTLRAMEKNGSIFIKLGQHLSSLNYLLPAEWCETFIPLQDKCPVSSFESIDDMVRKDTGLPIEHYFSEFEPRPIGAASLAQVHRAVLRETGEQVAVKVQHPALDEWAPLDLALTHFTFATIKRFFPEYDLTWLSEEMMVSLPQELDFNQEAQNAITAKDYFAKIHNVPLVIPAVVFSRRRILAMEYVAGRRPDDLAYLDEHEIDRDEVSAALARIFNEMIFGQGAPLHCDPHGGNIAIRHRPRRLGQKNNFDIILYDHGLYRQIPLDLRRSYAKLWLAVLDVDEPRMRRYAYEVAGIGEKEFPLFTSAITGREYRVVSSKGGLNATRTAEEHANIASSFTEENLLEQLVSLLGRVPRVMLLILKTNDLTRSLDENLHTRQGPIRTFLILARYASRAVYEEQLENIRSAGGLFWPPNLFALLRAWSSHLRTELKLNVYESWLWTRKVLGMAPMTVLEASKSQGLA